MENSIFHRLSNVLWGMIVTLMVLLAIYVSMGRLLTGNLSAFQDPILRELNSRVPFTVEADKVAGEWQSFTPIVVLSGLRLGVEGSDAAPIELSAGRIGVDVLESLRSGSLQLTRLGLDGLNLRGELTAQGQFRLRGFDGGSKIGEWLRAFLQNVEFVGLRDNRLELALPGGKVRNLDYSLRLSREGSHRRVEAELLSNTGSHITVLAEGVGDPFSPKLFSGDLYLDIQTSDLGAAREMWANGPAAAWPRGELDLELWLAWHKGKPSIQARAEARELIIADEEQSWQVPLDRVSLEATLVEGKNRWTLFASDMEIEKDDALARVPRLQLDVWEEALRVRALDVELQPLNEIAINIDTTPERLADVFRVLQPRGTLSSLEIAIGDRANPRQDWAVEANFKGLAVNSWKGAPGLSSATGYVELDQNDGFVVIDSQQLAMEFPTMYHQPLRYDDFYGTINIDWDALALRLSSGLVSARAEEGDVAAFFALNIPLVRKSVGLEMELMVGLHDAHPTHRVKYVPNVLNAGLREWLNNSIGDGQIEQGAFLWRGTLARNTAPYRTVQLAFNVADTEVNYHLRWPPVTVSEGIIFIDDSKVSVWSGDATLYDSQLDRLSVEVWPNEAGQLMLGIDGSLAGPASDGLAVLNSSPLNDIVSGAFKDWILQGELQTSLQLELNLKDRAVRPVVNVATRWREVDLDIRPGKLPVRGINGLFNYSTTQGFSSTDLAGSLWDEPLTVAVEQLKPVQGKSASAVEVAIATRVDMADVRQWLNLDVLALAQGSTAVDIKVLVSPGESPLLSVDSMLQGVSLDLPTPWRKPAASKKRLSLESPLAGEGNRVSLDLDGELKLQLHVVEGALRSGALGVHEDAAAAEAGVLRVTGHAPLVHGDEWTEFITRYFYTGVDGADGAPPAAAGDSTEPAAVEENATALAIRLEELQADELIIWEQTLQDVEFSLAVENGRWHLDAETSWLKGELIQPVNGDLSTLTIQRLDLLGLSQLDLGTEEEAAGNLAREPLELPAMEVMLEHVHRGDLILGQLDFQLRTEGDLLSVENITGDITGMTIVAEHPGRLLWRQGEDSLTRLEGRLEFEDLGQTLGKFGYEKIVETDRGSLDFDLNWPGAPQDFSMQQGQGSVRVDIGKGRFLEAPSGASGALKVVNILNLADIVRRLSMSHMFESGIPFDSVEGEVYLHSGVIEVADMDVKGPSSFYFSGVSDVSEQTLDGELVATLPMASNLPWMAALAASLPIAAGVYVVSKVFKKQVNRLSSAVYSIEGSWDDPRVDFEHIFDDTGQRSQNQLTAQSPAIGEPLIAPDPQEAWGALIARDTGEPPIALDPQEADQAPPP